jgi:hypothetical protein
MRQNTTSIFYGAGCLPTPWRNWLRFVSLALIFLAAADVAPRFSARIASKDVDWNLVGEMVDAARRCFDKVATVAPDARCPERRGCAVSRTVCGPQLKHLQSALALL